MSGEPTRAIVEQAALWHARLGDEERAQHEQREFETWRTANPAHSLVFDRIAGLSARIGGHDKVEDLALKRMFSRKRRSAAALLSLLVLAAGGWFASQQPAVRIWLADQSTAPGEQISLPLADGSRILITHPKARSTWMSVPNAEQFGCCAARSWPKSRRAGPRPSSWRLMTGQLSRSAPPTRSESTGGTP